MRFLGPKSCKFKFSWPLAKSGCLFSEVFGTIILQIQIFLASGQEWMPVSRGFLDQHLDLYLPPCWNNKGATFWVGSVAQEAFMGERQGQFWAQDAHISSLASQFWTFFCRPTNWPRVKACFLRYRGPKTCYLCITTMK